METPVKLLCKDRDCIIFKAPNINKIKNQIFKFQDKCYTFKENIEKCDNRKKIVHFA